MLTNEVKTSIKGLKKDEILTKMRSGEIVPPPKGPDREEFLKLAAMTPEERDNAFEAAPAGELPPAAPTTPDNNGDTSKGDQGSIPAVTKKWWEEDGYESEEKGLENLKELRRVNAALQSSLDQLNAKEGKRGQELKTLREQVNSLAKEREELVKKTQPKIEEPTRPKKPNPNDYVDGKLDDGYQNDLEKYLDEMATYTEAVVDFKIDKKVSEVNSTVSTIKDDFEQRITATANQNTVDPIEKVFKDDIPTFQKKFGLEMSVDAWTVNQMVLNLSSPDIGVKARAQQFVDTFPPADKAKWAKITKAVNAAYDFSTGQPVARYNKIETALYDQGLLGSEFNIITPSKLSPGEEKAMMDKKKTEIDGSVSVPPAANAANRDIPASGSMSQEEEVKRYKDLLIRYNATLNKSSQKQFEASPEYEELKRLRMKLTGKLPSYMR